MVEAPSVTSGPDAYTLAQAADAAILVVEVPRHQRPGAGQHRAPGADGRERARRCGRALARCRDARSVIDTTEAGPVVVAGQPFSLTEQPEWREQRDWAEQPDDRNTRRPERDADEQSGEHGTAGPADGTGGHPTGRRTACRRSAPH